MNALGIILAAVVTYVAPDGIYLDEGATHGVRVGDAVQVGKQTLTVVAVSPGQSRTGPPANPFALTVGAEARVQKTGEATAKADPGPREPAAPAVDADAAAAWWPAAGDGWIEPRPLPDGATVPQGPTELRIAGLLGLRGRAVGQGTLGWRAEAYTRLAVDDAHFWYRHDARLNLDRHGGRWPEAPVDVRRLEAGWREAGWGLRGGRMMLHDPLAASSLDGAAVEVRDVGLDSVEIFAGVAPHPIDRIPEVRNPQVGVAAERYVELGDDGDGLTLRATALVSAFGGALDRAALAPDISLYAGPLRLLARAEIDAHPGRAAHAPVEATRLFGSARVELTDWLDVQARYDRYAPRPLPSFPAQVTPAPADARQSAFADVRLDAGEFGVLRVSTGVSDGRDGWMIVPGVDYRVALGEHLDLSLGAFERRETYTDVRHGRAGLAIRWDAPWPVSLDLGARVTDVAHSDRAELNHTELTGELGLWMATPAGFDLRLSAERTGEALAAPGVIEPATVLFGDLRWRFGD